MGYNPVPLVRQKGLGQAFIGVSNQYEDIGFYLTALGKVLLGLLGDSIRLEFTERTLVKSLTKVLYSYR